MDLPAKPRQVFRLAGKEHAAVLRPAVKQGPDADGVPGGKVSAGFSVIEDQGKLRVQHPEHLRAVLPVKGEQDLAVGLAQKGIPLLFQPGPNFPEAVNFPVADQMIPAQGKGLHALRLEPHDRQAVKAQPSLSCINNAGVVRTAGSGPDEPFLKARQRKPGAAISHDGTHGCPLLLVIWSGAGRKPTVRRKAGRRSSGKDRTPGRRCFPAHPPQCAARS